MATAPGVYDSLAEDSQRAFDWAAQFAAGRGPDAGIDSIDLLLGIFFVQPDSSEPMQLLEHFGIPASALTALLPPDRRLSPTARPPAPAHGFGSSVSTGDEVMGIMASASRLAQSAASEDPRPRVEHLFGGILQQPTFPAGALLQRLFEERHVQVSVTELGNRYPEFVRGSPHPTYAEFLSSANPWTPRRPTLASFDADSVVGATRPPTLDAVVPLDWVGIGPEVDAFAYLLAARSLKPPLAVGLFGDWGSGKSFFMQALQRRVFAITANAREAGKPQRDLEVFKSVVQIEFNAWHYVESELWASLVEHIFRNLRAAEDEIEAKIAERRQKLIAQIETTKRDLSGVQGAIKATKTQLTDTQRRRRELEKERTEAEDGLQAAKLAAVEAVGVSIAENKDKIEQVGVPVVANSAVEFVAAAVEARDLVLRAGGLVDLVRSGGRSWMIAIAGVLAIGPALSVVLALIGAPGATNAIAAISAFLAAGAALLRKVSAWTEPRLKAIEGARAKVEKVQHDQDDKAAKLEAELASTRERLAQEQARERTLTTQLTELGSRMARVGPADVLSEFIDTRIGSDDYTKRLGVPAIVRRDFEFLSKAVARTNREFLETDDGKSTEPTPDVHRIVLYIDDLDRCPPAIVVKVLQAVHLLLAFPLFVVVVAVDARWLAKSLEQHYGQLLSTTRPASDPPPVADGERSPATEVESASPDDYLEKIFQIPFWVRPLGPEARLRMIDGLVAPSVVWGNGSGGVGGAVGDAGADDIAPEVIASLMERLFGSPPAEPQTNPEALLFRPHELHFMESMAPVMGASPRAVKRFVNVYRLLKVVGEASQPDAFLSDAEGATFQQVILVLAIVTGLPALAPDLCRRITEPGNATKTLATLLATATRGASGARLDERARLASFIKGPGGAVAALPAATLAPWVRQIARFSFRSETATE